MDCLDDADALALANGQLAEARREAALVHLADCEACRVLVAAAAANTASREPASDEVALPQSIGRFAVTGVAGHGAMGIVYRGHDDRLERPVALKLIRPELLGSDAQRRLEREARALAKIRHPGVVGVYEVGDFEDALFLAMEFVEGVTLEAWLRAEPREPEAILARFCEAGEGLLAAHQAGLVHRDFKPANAMVDASGHVRVTDFGLVSDGAVEVDRRGRTVEDLALTQTGAIMGTPAYMAPEQLAGQSVGPRADQFSFCVALFEALAGHRPFEATTFGALLEALSAGRPSSPRRPIPRRIHRALLRGLAAQPEDRFGSMRELLDVLAPPRRGARWPWLLGSAAVSGLLALVFGRGLAESRDASSTHVDDTPAELGAEAATNPEGELAASEAIQAAPESPCDRLSARWDLVWSEDARKHIRAVVEATWPEQPPRGTRQEIADAWEGLGRVKASITLDTVNRLGDEWRAEVADTCAHVERQDAFAARARRQCLDDALTRLEALIEAPPRDLRFVDALEPVRRHVRRCTTQLVAKLSMPADEVAELAAEARTMLARASAMRLDGRAREAQALADEALVLGKEVGDNPLLAEIWLERGLALAQLGPGEAQADPAAESLHEAVAYAQQDAHHRVLREASDALAWQYAFGLEDPRQAQRWLESATRLDDRVEPTPVELRQRRLIEAHLARRQGDEAEARRILDALLEDELDPGLLGVAVDELVASLGDDAAAIDELHARLAVAYRLDPAALEVLAR